MAGAREPPCSSQVTPYGAVVARLGLWSGRCGRESPSPMPTTTAFRKDGTALNRYGTWAVREVAACKAALREHYGGESR
jgi:hypothetical protein